MIAPCDPHGQKIHLPTQATNGTSTGSRPFSLVSRTRRKRAKKSKTNHHLPILPNFPLGACPASHVLARRDRCAHCTENGRCHAPWAKGGTAAEIRNGGSNPVLCAYPVLLPLKIRPEHVSGFATHRPGGISVDAVYRSCFGAKLSPPFKLCSERTPSLLASTRLALAPWKPWHPLMRMRRRSLLDTTTGWIHLALTYRKHGQILI